MIKILFVLTNINRQGPVSQLYYLCKYIDRDAFDPLIVTISKNSLDSSMLEEFSKLNIRVIEKDKGVLSSILFATAEIQKIIDNGRVQIVQSYGFRADIVSAYLKRVIKITSVRNTLLVNYKKHYGAIIGSIIGNINLYFIKKNDYIVSCSKSVHSYMNTLHVNSNMILNSIDEETIINENSELRISDEKSFVTVSSRLKGKNIEFLAEVFANSIFLKGYKLVIVGYVEADVLEKYKNFNNILFTGKVRDFMSVLHNMDYFISASTHEGMPNAVLEALLIGKPVILSDIPSHKEVLSYSNAKIGTLFRNNDKHDLIEKIESIINNDYSELSRNCKKIIMDNFSARKMAKEYETLYLSICTKYSNLFKNSGT